MNRCGLQPDLNSWLQCLKALGKKRTIVGMTDPQGLLKSKQDLTGINNQRLILTLQYGL